MRIISKSSYMAGLDCPRKLWQRLHDRASAAPLDGMTRLRMEFGTRFGKLAHVLFPDAILIPVNYRMLKEAEEETRRAIDRGAGVILEATFRHRQCRVISDVIDKQADGSWHLIEVKSSSRLKPEHIPDLAYQKWVIEQCGQRVSRCSVIHSNKDGVWPDRQSIFDIVDVTDKVELAVQAVPGRLQWMLEIASQNSEAPDSRAHLSKLCHDCEFKQNVCWKDIADFTIYDVVHSSKIPMLEADGILFARDIPADYKLAANDSAHVRRIREQSTDIDRVAVRSMLEQLEYPVYFLDFETVAVPVPLFDGIHPWEQVPFQFSLHIAEKTGETRHVEYLHEEYSDPTGSIVRALVKNIGRQGSIVVYHAQMEAGVLDYLAERHATHSVELRAMKERLWDLETIFLRHYRDWRFGSRSSIKVVLPVLVPKLSYDDQEIQDGGTASISWVEMLETGDFIERQAKADALRSYCERDTLAMVELLNCLRAL